MLDQVRNTKIYIYYLTINIGFIFIFLRRIFIKIAKGNEQIINAIEKIYYYFFS